MRSDDLFFGSWLDFSKVRIPQADEQQRLLANLITQMNLDRTPLPRFWYLPRGEKAAVVMTGDDHGSTGGTAGQFDIFKAESPPGCSVADWECVRTTSYVYAASDFTGFEQPTAYQAEGFEIALHLNTGCANYTPADLDEAWTSQLADFNDAFPGLNAPRTNRTHCITWGDWVGEPKAELKQGVRLDTNYYYWPSSWVQDRPGMFTGSGFPQRFADEDGSLVDVYQATTQLADEALITVPTHIAALLDGALGDDGYYGVFTANMHTDSAPHTGANQIVEAAQQRGVPVVSAEQMLDWLDGRNDSSFQDLSFLGGLLRFTVDRGAGARGLQAMLPVTAATGELSDLRRDGSPVGVTRRTVKGIEYAMFDAAAGDYTAAYGGADATPPNTTIDGVTTAGDGASFTFSSSEPGSRFECRLDGAAFAACASPGEYSGLAARLAHRQGAGDRPGRQRGSHAGVGGLHHRRRGLCGRRRADNRRRAGGGRRPSRGRQPGRRRQPGGGPESVGERQQRRPLRSARHDRQAHRARLGEGRRDPAGDVPAHRAALPRRGSPPPRRAPARRQDPDGVWRQDRERHLPA